MPKEQTSPFLPKISIITVVYNAAKELKKTIESVAEQTYENIECIVIDGASTDGTLDVIKANADLITKWISEPDKGLYYAMNKGISMAEGEFVWFLNAGDLIASSYTTEEILMSHPTLADIYYGETIIADENNNHLGRRRLKAPKVLTSKSFHWGMLVCHQSILIRRSIVGNYDTQYRISADFDWVLSALEKANTIVNTNVVISVFVIGGISGKNFFRTNWERYKIMAAHYGFFQSILYNFLMSFRLIYTYLKLGRL